jgi:hypothetical protein
MDVHTYNTSTQEAKAVGLRVQGGVSFFVAQMVEYLPSKLQTLSSNASPGGKCTDID